MERALRGRRSPEGVNEGGEPSSGRMRVLCVACHGYLCIPFLSTTAGLAFVFVPFATDCQGSHTIWDGALYLFNGGVHRKQSWTSEWGGGKALP